VGDHQRALAAGDVDTIVAAFEPDGYAREPAGGRRVHRHLDGLRTFYELLFSNGGGIPLEHCAVIDDGRACALEYIVVRWGRTELAAADQGVGLARALRTGRPRPRRPSVRAAFRPTSAAAERAGDARLIAEYLSQSPADLST